MIKTEWRRSQVLDRLSVDPLFRQFVEVTGPIWPGAGLRKCHCWAVSPLNAEWHHPLPRRVALGIAVIPVGSEEPSGGGALVANLKVDLDETDPAELSRKAREWPSVPDPRALFGVNIRVPLERALDSRQLLLGHGRKKELNNE